jgi:hypothetical protein
VYRKGSLAVDDEQFDRLTQSVNSRFTRRGLGGLAAGALASLGLMATADAKKKKKKKKKPSPPPPPSPLPPGTNTSCQNLGTACGNTAVCVCGLDKASVQTCENVVVPPDGISFNNRPCQSNVNCGAGQVCDAGASVCVSACPN